MDIILYLLQLIQYQHKQICWLLNFICRYIPLKQWAFDDSCTPLLCEKIVLWLLQLYIIQQRVSLFCAIFGIYSFIASYLLLFSSFFIIPSYSK